MLVLYSGLTCRALLFDDWFVFGVVWLLVVVYVDLLVDLLI